ncbi:methyltransferase family protein [Candidatus Neomarinimicrobiota bacterium]
MIFSIKIFVFIGVTAGFIYLHRHPLRNLRSHGFYRFFAWEIILIMILLNLDQWFTAPFSLHQITSWLLLLISAYLVIQGALLLHKVGRPSRDRIDDPALLGIEKTTELVMVGIYRYIRHPLYSSLLFLTWGVFFKRPSILGGCLAILATIFLTITTKLEEIENIRFFGVTYQNYMNQSKLFIPFIW